MMNKELKDLGHYQYQLSIFFSLKEYQTAYHVALKEVALTIRPKKSFRKSSKAHHILVEKEHKRTIELTTRNYFIGVSLQELLDEKSWVLINCPVLKKEEQGHLEVAFQICPLLERIDIHNIKVIEPVLQEDITKTDIHKEENFDERVKISIRRYMMNQIFDQLLKKNIIQELPEMFFRKDQKETISPFNVKEDNKLFRVITKSDVSEDEWKKSCIEVILSSYIRLNNLELNQEKFQQILHFIVNQNENPQESMHRISKDQKILQLIAYQTLKEQSCDMILQMIQKEPKNYSRSEIEALIQEGENK